MENVETGSDPYQAPQAPLSEDPTGSDAFERAGLGRRLLNLIVDYIVYLLLAAVVMTLAYVLASPEQAAWLDTAAESQTPGWLDFAGLVLYLLYYLSLELAFGRTVGKLVTGTRVIKEDGSKAGAGSILGRSCARYIPFEFLSIFFSQEKRTAWHDSLSGTLVVRVKK